MPNLTYCIKAGSIDGRPGWLLKFPYDKNTVQAIKTIPYTHREWRPDTVEWWASEDYTETLKDIFPNFNALVFQQKAMDLCTTQTR